MYQINKTAHHFHLIAIAFGVFVGACGEDNASLGTADETDTEDCTGEGGVIPSDTDTGDTGVDAGDTDAGPNPVDTDTGPAADVVITANTGIRWQTMDGFGAALAFYQDWVTSHPNKAQMYDLVFGGLGLDILRLRNVYRYEPDFSPASVEFVAQAKARVPDIQVLMSSWSPPEALKSNGSTVDGGTLIKENGNFVYGEFADYWYDALVAYDALGVRPDFISIQNEPDYVATWESCEFEPVETTDIAGYAEAFDAVHARLQALATPPKMLGPEELGIGYGNFDKYSSEVKDHAGLYGYAYHLYHGGDETDPVTFIDALDVIRNDYGNKPNFMTEFGRGDWYQTALIIYYTLKQAHASAYLYWDLIWDGQGLVAMDNPWDEGSWSNADGYWVEDVYYGVKHFSKRVSAGYTHVQTDASSGNLLHIAFVSGDGQSVTFVLFNQGSEPVTVATQVAGTFVQDLDAVQSVAGNFDQSIPVDGTVMTLPPASITTVVGAL